MDGHSKASDEERNLIGKSANCLKYSCGSISVWWQCVSGQKPKLNKGSKDCALSLQFFWKTRHITDNFLFVLTHKINLHLNKTYLEPFLASIEFPSVCLYQFSSLFWHRNDTMSYYFCCWKYYIRNWFLELCKCFV